MVLFILSSLASEMICLPTDDVTRLLLNFVLVCIAGGVFAQEQVGGTPAVDKPKTKPSPSWKVSLSLEEGTEYAEALDEAVVEGSLINLQIADVANCEITLNGGQHVAIPNADGSFRFNGVGWGSYALGVSHPYLAFDKILLEVSLRQSVLQVSGFQYSLEAGKGAKLPYPMRLSPIGWQEFFQGRDEFNLLGLLKNPMILIGLVCMGLMVLLPKVQSSLDHEVLQELSQSPAIGGGAANAEGGSYVSPFVSALASRS